MKKFLLATIGSALVGRGRSRIGCRYRPSRHRRPRLWPRFTVGPASTSAPTVVGVRATSAGMSRTSCAPIAAIREGCHDATGGTVGGQIGYRWQATNWVFGLEAQGNWADLNGSNVSVFIPAWTNNSKIEAFGLFTGQVGYAWNNVLWYVKGGAAVTDDKYRGTVSPTVPLAGTCSMMRVKHAGAASSERASNSDSHRIGRLRSSTITFSWVTATSASYREAFWVLG